MSAITDMVECPLCFLDFPEDGISIHAAQCYGLVSHPEHGVSDHTGNGAAQNVWAFRHKKDRWMSTLTRRLVLRKILYTASDVQVHPSSQACDHIPGDLWLYSTEESEVYIQWEPLTVSDTEDSPLASSSDDGRQAHAHRYAVNVRATGLASIRKEVPRIGYSSIVLQLADGVTLPPLYFHGGYRDLRDLFDVLSQHVELKRTTNDPNLYLVGGRAAGGSTALDSALGLPRISVRDHAWSLLEKFSQVSKYTRDMGWNTNEPLARPGARILDEQQVQAARCASHDEFDADFEMLPNHVSGAGPPSADPGGTPGNGTRPYPAPTPIDIPARTPVTYDRWLAFMDSDGRIMDTAAVRAEVFANGLDAEVRKEVWRFLLGYWPWASTAEQRQQIKLEKAKEYHNYKRQWQNITPAQEVRFHKFRDRKHRIEKDVFRTDRHVAYYADDDSPGLQAMNDILLTYAFYNFDLAYVQGMSDLLSPILFIMDGDEPEGFWAFAGLMDAVETSFQKDQSGVHAQLGRIRRLLEFADHELFAHLERQGAASMIFCFRWVIIMMKREFAFDDIMRLWEVLWTRHLSSSFLVFVCAGILHGHRDAILSCDMGLDGLLRYINDLEMTMSVEEVLARGEALYHRCANADALPDDLRELMGEHARPLRRRTTSVSGMVHSVTTAEGLHEGTPR